MRGIKSLKEAWEEAQQQGWSSGETSSLQNLRFEARLDKWEEVETRSGQGTETMLRPTSQAAAPYPRSISAVYGLDEQPLHVDGAHFPTPPDVVLLFCDAPNETPTNVLSIKELDLRFASAKEYLPSEYLRHGIFIVGSGPAAFLAPVLDAGRLRYDPNVMEPADARARDAADYLRSLQDKATPFHWSVPKSYLLIANRLALHGRAKVVESDSAREVTRVAYRIGAKR
ncbi:hypothetical protein OOZ51_04070 [Arthrobacter sp. MI7-26]|uniref:hypothetical protein n=1 Tax=Arthrobacter sp. MI7-26 TaxID=2993653 RepID=UPI002248B83F|nr:hypothetical protein [Arthrobacter sp. MI7-26]MCX2746991.1 hypothetical protein [Arthrobacter sp. MI7-26]